MPPTIAPSRRLAWDVNDIGFWFRDTDVGPTNISAAQRDILNSEDTTEIPLGWANQVFGYMGIVFQEPKDLYGAFVAYWPGAGGALGALQTSTDTTNGFDGTWTQRIANLTDTRPINQYRDPDTFFAAGCTGIRARVGKGVEDEWSAFFAFGIPGSGATIDRLDFLDPTNRYTVPLDYGDQGQGAEVRTQIAVKNFSATLTAQQVTIAAQGLAGLSSGWYDFSIDDSVYTSSLNVGDLVPGASATFWVRQIIPATVNPLGLQSARIFPTPSAWV